MEWSVVECTIFELSAGLFAQIMPSYVTLFHCRITTKESLHEAVVHCEVPKSSVKNMHTDKHDFLLIMIILSPAWASMPEHN